MSDQVELAVIGLGMAAKPHALALSELNEHINVRGVYARSADSREKFSKNYGFPIATDLLELAMDPRLDCLLLLTPPNARTEIVSLFANYGKHILSEKPLERTAEAAEEIVGICSKEKVSLGVVFQHRFRAASEALQDMLSNKALGAVRIVRAEVPWWRDQSYYDEYGRGSYARDGGGVLISQAIHTLDLMLSMTGPVKTVHALCATTPFHRMESEDFASGLIEFESGAFGSVFTSTASFPGDAESLIFNCDKATAILKSGILIVKWRDGRTERFGNVVATGGGSDPMAFPYDWHKSLIHDFVISIKNKRQPRVTGFHALQVHRLINAFEKSSREGRKVLVQD